MTSTSVQSPELIQRLNEDIKKFPEVHPITPDMKIERTGVSRMVMLDRYAFKDIKLETLQLGDLVIITYKDDPKFPRRGYGHVTNIDGEFVTVELDKQFEDGATITVQKNKIQKPLEIFYEQIAKRNATGLSEVESVDVRSYWRDEFERILKTGDFVPAGRVLMGAGSNKGVTFFNCYVMPFIHDSRGGIGEHRKMVMEIMSRGGGVGTNGSTLRPRDAICHGVNGRSSGSVTWLHDLSELTNLVEQGGSRRGAQMIMLNDNHPDIVEFIISKMQNPNVLRHIMNTTQDPLIKSEAERKLKFTALKEEEKAQLSIVLESLTFKAQQSELFPLEWPGLTDVETKALEDAQTRLNDGGVYDVHNPEFLTGANISVNVSNEFMDAVENDTEFNLRFPDIDSYDEEMRRIYDEKWQEVGDVREWEAMGYATKVYYSIKARELWNLINTCATYAAEPGIFFIDNANDMTNAKAYGQKVVATNPCGEQPLAPWSVCNLAAINLANMTKDGQVDWERLKDTVRIGVRLQDNVIDTTPYFLEQNTKQALGERRIGMGVMGLHDLLIRCEKAYGSPEGNELVDRVFEVISQEAYRASIGLAKERGSFPFLDVLPNGEQNLFGREKFVQSGFMQKMPEDIRADVLEYGIRNSHLLTVAPTGSTGAMMNVSTGLEPYFSYVYYRSGRLGKFIPVVADIAVEWLERNGYEVTDENVFEMVEKLPSYFNSAMTLAPEQHVAVQCIIQKHVDSSISKTVNAPKGYKVSQVQEVYESLHRGGAKGGTVYVDGSRDAQVLSLTAEDNETTTVIESEPVDVVIAAVQTIQESSIKLGTEIGDNCYVCEVGTLVDAGGCVTCNNCGSQIKCGL